MGVHAADVSIGRLRFAYWFTLIGAGAAGVVVVFGHSAVASLLRIPGGEPFFIGAVGAGWVGFAAVSVLGLRRPVTFSPILLLQLVYKAVWLVAVFVPALVRGPIPVYGWLLAVVFAAYVAVDILAIPFRYLLRSDEAQATGLL